MELLLFLLLIALLVVAWQILLDVFFIFGGTEKGRKPRGWYRRKYQSEIESGRMPEALRRHVIDILYAHRFDWFLLVPLGLAIASLLWVSPWVLATADISHDALSGGTVIVSVMGLPILAFVWFIRSYERERELIREEANLWSSEFDRLMSAAASEENEVLRRAALRQLQDYLSGAKWRTNQRSNSTAIFELFSSIVHKHWERANERIAQARESGSAATLRAAVTKESNHPILLTIGAVLRAVFSQNREGTSPGPHVSQNSLASLHFDHLDLKGINLSSINCSHSTFLGVNLDGADLRGANLSWTNLNESILDGANLSGASLTRAGLRGASLLSADLSEAKMNRANMSSAILIGADLTRARLHGVNLSDSDLTDADLQGADLRRANLTGAQLMDVALTEANLFGTGLFKRETLRAFPHIKHDDKTIWDKRAPKKKSRKRSGK